MHAGETPPFHVRVVGAEDVAALGSSESDEHATAAILTTTFSLCGVNPMKPNAQRSAATGLEEDDERRTSSARRTDNQLQTAGRAGRT